MLLVNILVNLDFNNCSRASTPATCDRVRNHHGSWPFGLPDEASRHRRFRALLAKGFSASRVAGRIGLRPKAPGRWILRYQNGADAIAKFGWPTFMFGWEL